jgi:hypothetical protein
MHIVACVPSGTAKQKDFIMGAGAYNDLMSMHLDVHHSVYSFRVKFKAYCT